MVAYSFRPRFVSDIREGIKPHTIRNDRKRHARPGEQVQLYTGMRTKSCRLIGYATCVDVRPIRLDFPRLRVEIAGELFAESRPARDLFARSDGFENWTAMIEFWRNDRGERTRRGRDRQAVLAAFEGVIIRWKDFIDKWEQQEKAA